MSLLPQVEAGKLAAKFLGPLIALVVVFAVIGVLVWRNESLGHQLEAQKADTEKQKREVTRLNGEMDRADRAVLQAKTVNDALRAAVLRLNAENDANHAKAAQLEQDAAAARAKLAADQAAARQADAARRARLDKPSAADMNAVLRGVVGSM